MAKYKAYPEYKDSGVEWLGEIPDHWTTLAIKHVAQINPSKSCISIEKMKGMCSFIPMEKLKFNSLSLDEVKHVSDVYNGYTYFENEDILIAKVTPCFENKNMVVAHDLHNGIGFGSSEIYVLRCNDIINNDFLFYRLQEDNFMSIAEGAMTGAGGLKRVPSELLNNFKFGLPGKKEQSIIVNFLKHETAKIDNLIEKQQQLIELLKEKRQAVISHAVTKGLNPDVPMKDSGVEWLGEVPEHWGVTTLRNLIRNQDVLIQDGNHGELHPVAAEYVDEGIPFLMANNIRDSKVDLVECKRISKSRADKLRIGFAKAGDMLLTHKGTVGEVASIPDYIPEPYWMLTPQVTYYRWNKNKYDSKFCAYLFQSKCVQIQLEIIGSKQSTRSYVGLIAQGELIVVSPPLAEQQIIRNRLDIRTSRLEKMLTLAEKNIDLMLERRTALISAAVTGKIDVRDWVAPDTQDVEESQEAIA